MCNDAPQNTTQHIEQQKHMEHGLDIEIATNTHNLTSMGELSVVIAVD